MLSDEFKTGKPYQNSLDRRKRNLNAFHLLGLATLVTGQSQNEASNCNNDYVRILGGYYPALSPLTPTNALDRFCGEVFNLEPASTTSSTVCSRLSYNSL